MPDKFVNLRVPGPTPVPEAVAAAGARPMVNHRGPDFAAAMGEVLERLTPYFGSSQEPLLLTGSGTGAQEAAVVNVFSPGDEVLSVTSGVFGERFAAIAEAFGATVHRLHGEWGRAIEPAAVVEALRQYPDVKGIILTHNETSTGITNDLAAITSAIRREAGSDAVILVDGVSSIGALPFLLEEWDVDVAITGSQKAWMAPPGLAMAAVSERGWRAHREARMPRFYWDFSKARKNGEKRTTPFTPAVGIVHALQEALRLMTEEGMQNVFARHEQIGNRVREGIADLDLELFGDPEHASNTVTAVRVPADVDAAALLRDLRTRHGVVFGSGQDWLKGSIFRIGHMGWVHDQDVDHLLSALRTALDEARQDEQPKAVGQ